MSSVNEVNLNITVLSRFFCIVQFSTFNYLQRNAETHHPCSIKPDVTVWMYCWRGIYMESGSVSCTAFIFPRKYIVIRWYMYIQGRAIFGSGSPFDPVKYNDKLFVPAQVWNIALCINEVPKFSTVWNCDLYIELYIPGKQCIHFSGVWSRCGDLRSGPGDRWYGPCCW